LRLIIDTHVHIYPFYDIGLALNSILENFDRIDSNAVKVACLTERNDCDVFSELATNPPASVAQSFEITRSKSGNSLTIRSRLSEQVLYLLPGQQIITSENLEILSLNCPHRVGEGNTAGQTINEVTASGGFVQ